MIPPQLVPWRILALAVVVATLLTVASVYRVQRDSARADLLELQAAHATDQARAERAARERLQAAHGAAMAERERLAAQGRAAADRAAAAVSGAQAQAQAWRRRYEAAQGDPACATWSQEPIPCPVL